MKKSTFLKQVIIPFVFMAFTIAANAQLVGWKYKDAIKIQENSGSLKLNYQVLLTVNTQTLIAANKMNASGSDIRFAKDCSGATLYSYWIESGINTATTQIWVLIDSLPASGNRIIHMYYGNTTAPAKASFDSTFTPASRLIVPSGSVALTGVNNYSWFEVQAGASITVTPNARLIINARKIIIAGTINGDGAGFLGGPSTTNGQGPGAGKTSTGNLGTYGAGGAGYGAMGGNGGGADSTTTSYAVTGLPGNLYGTLNTDSIDMGSGGGGAQGVGGNGGGSVSLSAAVLELKSTALISVKGDAGVQAVLNGGGGGGAGGGILLKGNKVICGGILNVTGGNGGDGAYGGGGGAGGRIKILYDNSVSGSSTKAMLGGSPGPGNGGNFRKPLKGDTGTFYQGTYLAKEPTIITLAGASAGPDVMICTGSSTQLNATGGTAYTWSPAAGLSCTTCSNPMASPTATTNYSVSITANGCPTLDSVLVTVDPCLGVLNNNNTVAISVMPNPSNGVITFSMAGVDEKSVTLELFNLQGQRVEVRELNVTGGVSNEPLNFSGHAPGVYTLRVIASGSYIGNHKLMIQQ